MIFRLVFLFDFKGVIDFPLSPKWLFSFSQRLHDEFAIGLGDAERGVEKTAVLEVDFYRADDIAALGDGGVLR
jgi:hypothetical protein